MSQPTINVKMLLGHAEIVTTQQWNEDGTKCLLGGYSIHYDEHGKETHRTPNEWNLCVTYPQQRKRRSLWKRIWGLE